MEVEAFTKLRRIFVKIKQKYIITQVFIARIQYDYNRHCLPIVPILPVYKSLIIKLFCYNTDSTMDSQNQCYNEVFGV